MALYDAPQGAGKTAAAIHRRTEARASPQRVVQCCAYVAQAATPPGGGRGGFNPGRVSPSRSMAAGAAHLDLFSRLDRTHDEGAIADFTEERMELAYNALRSWKR